MCDKDTKIIIGIKTVPSGGDRRHAIRSTWGNTTNFVNYPVRDWHFCRIIGITDTRGEN